jgi:hypothetical protein
MLSKLLGCALENDKLPDASVQLKSRREENEGASTDSRSGNTWCVFCALRDIPSVILRNKLAFAIRDRTPVTAKHTLVFSYRRAETYFDLVS